MGTALTGIALSWWRARFYPVIFRVPDDRAQGLLTGQFPGNLWRTLRETSVYTLLYTDIGLS